MIREWIKEMLKTMGVEVNFKRNLWYTDAFEVQKRIIPQERPVIFDVGASEGSTVALYKKQYPRAIVHAFEPQPDSFQLLRNAASGMQDVHCNNFALSNEQGKSTFYRTNGSPSSSLLPPMLSGTSVDHHTQVTEQFEVTLDTLDQYCETRNIPRVDILKMDVQGNEMNILKGSQKILQQGNIGLIYSEVWFVKAYENQPLYEDLVLFLRQFGYSPFSIYDMNWDLDLQGRSLWADAIFTKTH